MLPFFIHESLLWWGLPLLGVPVLIHLINMLRHRRVKWAAMEFLLQSQKRHRTWIILKQLLLLLLRITAVAAIVLMLAQPLLQNQWSALFGGSKTHHVVLLDDSFSMSDRWANTSAFEEAKKVADRLAQQAAHRDSAQSFTLLRFSQAGRMAKGTQPDVLQKPVDGNFPSELAKVLAPMKTSETAVGPNEALEAVDRLPGKGGDENRVIYLISDFRTNQWEDPSLLSKTLQRLEKGGAEIHLVDCVDAARPNVAIVALQAGPGTRAAGVPLQMEVAVKNFGTTPAREVSVQLQEDGRSRPAVVIEEIPAGKTALRRFPVLFTVAGQHEITARLEGDPVAADNARYTVIDLPSALQVLIIDGDSKGQDAYFLATALSPGGNTNSGLKPVIETTRALRKSDLGKYQTIYLLDIDRLDPAEIDALENFAREGGGIGFFMGELCRSQFFNQKLYRGGKGLFPLPLAGPMELVVDRLEKTPDLEVTDHPIFSVFAGQRNSFVDSVVIHRYFAAPRDWAPEPDSSTRVIARLRNGAPLAVEHQFGQGRVIAMLTKASPSSTPVGPWNNWAAGNPSYVVAMLELQAYLSVPRYADRTRLVATPLDIPLTTPAYDSHVRFSLPAPASQTFMVEAQGSPKSVARLTETDASGIYEAQLTRTDGTVESHRFALNVAPDEGNLKKLDGQQLATRLAGLKYQYYRAQDVIADFQQRAGVNLGEGLMLALIVVLIGEQLFAYWASYHPAIKGGVR